jgi:putative Holliday junction resolvase
MLYKKYLGIDWGEKRIGLAIGDDETKIASPFKIAKDLDEVLQTVQDEDIEVIVLGKPLSIKNYQLRIKNDSFNIFFSELKNKVKIPVEIIDERLSSKAADALIGDKKTKVPRDMAAAMLILQNYLDKLP